MVVALQRLAFASVASLLSSGAATAQAMGPGREPVIGLPCEGCEAVFEGIPNSFSSRGRITPGDEPGQPMVIVGVVRDLQGRPAAGIILYAYHTNARGVYPTDDVGPGVWSRRHGKLRAWVVTDSLGRYRFETIRPASYPTRASPAHVHMHVIEPGCCTYYIASLHFSDDPLLTEQARREAVAGRGGSGLTTPSRDRDDTWHVTRDIILGMGIPEYSDVRARHR